jgi:hypothetical protein
MLAVVLMAALAVLPVAAQQADSTNDYSFVWFANAGPDSSPVDIYFGDEADEPLVSDLAFGESTEMYVLPSNQRGFVLREAGADRTAEPIFSADWSLTPNQSYLILATGLAERKAFILEPITIVRNKTQGKARLRIVNAISGGPALNVATKSGTSLAQNTAYITVADAEVEPGDAEIVVQTAGGETRAEIDVALAADTVYVLVITGGPEGTPAAAVTVIEVPQDTTRVRIVNEADAPFDIVQTDGASEKQFAAQLAPGATSEFIDVPSDTVSFLVKRPGAGTANAVSASIPVELRPGRDVTLTIRGSGERVEIVQTSDVLSEGLVVGGTGEPVGTATPDATSEPTAAPTVEPTAEPTAQATTTG